MWMVITVRKVAGGDIKNVFSLFRKRKLAVAKAQALWSSRKKDIKNLEVHVYKAEKLRNFTDDSFDEKWKKRIDGTLIVMFADEILDVTAEFVVDTVIDEEGERLWETKEPDDVKAIIWETMERLIFRVGKKLLNRMYVPVGEPVEVFKKKERSR